MYDRRIQTTTSVLDQIHPQRVGRHAGHYADFLDRHEHEAVLVAQAGLEGLHKVAPFLFERASDERALRCAYDYMARHARKAPGPDGLTYDDLASESEVWGFCRSLRDDLRSGAYQPGPERVVSVPKGGGRGERSLSLQNIGDRVVQRSVLSIVRPLIDPHFDDRSFGYRPGPNRTPLHAVALAEKYLLRDGRGVWLTQEINDAFPSVPLPRLLQLVQNCFFAENLTELVARILGGASTGGLREGGSLSPLLLNLYLHHLLDRPWRERHPDLPLIRVADDLLVPCQSINEAEHAQDGLADLLASAGMALRERRAEAVCTLTPQCPAVWLGIAIDDRGGAVRYRTTERAWERLEDALGQAQAEPDPDWFAAQVVGSWLVQMAPCVPSENNRTGATLKRVKAIAHACGVGTALRRVQLRRLWSKEFAEWDLLRWQRNRR